MVVYQELAGHATPPPHQEETLPGPARRASGQRQGPDGGPRARPHRSGGPRLPSSPSSKGNIVLLDRRHLALLCGTCRAWTRGLHPWSWTRALHPLLTPPRHEVNPVGKDVVLAPFLAVLPCPTAPLQTPLDERSATFPEILTGRFRLAAERNNIDKADVFPPLGRVALPTTLGATLLST